ncbi:MAG: hypothetical protein IJC45_08545 [Clostridia bacterium]|nr:hypothetical protein [Clostridia bacterium]
MKKKILSLLLAFVFVFSAFIPVNILPETEVIADAATFVTCKYEPIEISTYQELDEALRQAYNGMVLQLTQDLNVGATSADITIRPDMTNMTVVLDLNGHNIKYSQVQNSTFRGIDLNCANSNFHIINSAYDKGDAKATIGGHTTGFSFLFLDNPTASCYIGPGVEIKGSNATWALVCLDFFKNFVMYESDITVNSVLADNTTDCIMFAPAQGYGSAYNNSNFRLNKCNLTTKKGDCIDLRYFGTFTANKSGAMSFVLNQTMLYVNHDDAYAINLSHAQNASSNVNVGELCYEPGIINVYGNNPYVGSCFFSGKIQNIFSGCDIYFYNDAYRTSNCSHSSNRANIFACSAREGHIWVCSKCYCDYYYSGHSYKSSKVPTATAAGNTSGYDCSCGYATYYDLPADTPIDPFSGVIEVDTWEEIKTAAANPVTTRVKLTSDIAVTDHEHTLTITPATRGEFVIDLNGHKIDVNSNKTQYLFDLSKATYGEFGTHLAIVDSTDMGGGDIFFTTTQKGASVVNLAHKANSLTVIRVTINLGSETDNSLNNTEAWAQTFAIDCKAAHMLNIYTAEVNNYKQNGTSIRFVMETADVFKNTTVRIYRSTFDFKTFGLDFDNNAIIKPDSFKDFTISNNNTFTPLNSTARVMDVNGSTNTATLGDIVDADYHFVDDTYSVSPTKTLAYSNFDAGKEYRTKWRWNSSNVCAHEDFVSVLHAVFGDYQYCTRCKKGFGQDHHIVVDDSRTTYADCTQDGEIFYICDDPGCGYEYSVKDISTGHIPNTDDEGDDIIYRKCPASCSSEGVAADYFECFVCRELILLETGEITTENDVIIPKNGEHDFKDYEKCEPTCVSDGRTLAYKQCVNCSTIRNENLTPAVEYTGSDVTAFLAAIRIPKVASNHKMTKYVKKPATCTEEGIKETFEICEYCNEVHKESGSLTGDAAMEFFFDVVIPKLSHNYEWVVVTPAQVGVKGKEEYKCKTCGDVKETREIPALEPEYLLGDVDLNGKVEVADARLALRAAVSLDTLTGVKTKAADADKNSKVEVADARLILRTAVGLQTLS